MISCAPDAPVGPQVECHVAEPFQEFDWEGYLQNIYK